GKRYSSTGVYTDSLKSIHGCDSVFRLNLTVWPVFVSIDTQEICNGEMLMWRGRRLTASGSYYDSLRTVHGCDSVFRLLLNVRPVYRVADTVRVCAGERVKWHGGEYTQSGTYSDTLKTQFGCDSVCTLWLQVRPVYLFTDTASVCADALPYKWHGRELAAEGVYYDSLKTANGCDSVYLLSLVSNPLYFESFTDTVCEGTAYNRYGFDLPADSTVGSPFRQWVDSLKTVNGCDSVVCLNLYIRRLPKEMHPISGDTLISVAGTYMYYTDTIPGITAYEWSVSPSSIHQTSVAGKVWLNLDKNAMGWDTLTLVGHHACGVTAPRSLVIHVVVGLPVSQASRVEGFRVFPNPANDDVCIELSDYESWQSPEWVLCDAQGRRIASGKVDGVQTHIRLDDCPRGIYFVSLLSAGSRKTSIKVVKY
ncbi:MAG: T9SS type A sorting domain-containing protein, partial [Bacteroidales bacterium]|nr:T9SS type A sorting domain-containing protein [Bacteroidales bacterium]